MSVEEGFLSGVKNYRQLSKYKGEDAYCVQQLGSGPLSESSYQSDKLVPLASISKLLTSYWALSVLGPFYRFETHFFLVAVDARTIDLHISGSRDPYYTYEKLFFIVSELNRIGITQIRHLTFDENLTIYLGHRDPNSANPSSLNAWTENPNLVTGLIEPSISASNLELVFNVKGWKVSAKKRYAYALDLAKKFGMSMVPNPKMSIGDVALKRAEDFRPSGNTQHFVMRSAPLFRYLKDMNNFSNNYVADQIFLRLGGQEKAARFFETRLNLDKTSLQLHTGSGLPLREPSRVDNKGSCAAVLKVVNAMSTLLTTVSVPEDEFQILKRKNLSLLDIMLIVGVDEIEKINGLNAKTTYSGSENQEGAAIAKTGLINSAINIAGAVFTNEGIYLYGIFIRTALSTEYHNPTGNNEARALRRALISDLIQDHKGAKKVPIDQHTAFFPVDTKSMLRDLTPEAKSLTLN